MVINFSCSSDDSKIIEESQDSEVSTNILSISYPQETGSYMGDTHHYEYDESNKVSEIRFGGIVYGVNHISDNLIELNLLEENISNLEIETKTSIHLNDNRVQKIITNTTSSSPSISTKSRDSVSYIYENNYPFRIEHYSKNFNSGNYQLKKEIDFTISNGNITKKITKEGEVIKTSTYNYDSEPHIKYGESSYETPLTTGLGYILIHDKLGIGNTNNIASMSNSFETPYTLTPEYKTINYSRAVDSDNRIIEISISGTTIATHPGYPESEEFTDKKGVFSY